MKHFIPGLFVVRDRLVPPVPLRVEVADVVPGLLQVSVAAAAAAGLEEGRDLERLNLHSLNLSKVSMCYLEPISQSLSERNRQVPPVYLQIEFLCLIEPVEPGGDLCALDRSVLDVLEALHELNAGVVLASEKTN